jgi:hypothetical protein
MTNIASFTKIENELEGALRQSVNTAEASADVQLAYATFVREVFSRLTGEAVVLDEGDVLVDPKAADGYTLGPGILENDTYAKFLKHSDLSAILRRQAEDSVKRINHLDKHTERAEAKMFPRPDRKF